MESSNLSSSSSSSSSSKPSSFLVPEKLHGFHSFAGTMDEKDTYQLDISFEAKLPGISISQPILSNAIVCSNGVEILGVTLALINNTEVHDAHLYSVYKWELDTGKRHLLCCKIKTADMNTQVFLSSNSIILADKINELALPPTYEGQKSKSKNYIKFENIWDDKKSVIVPAGIITKGAGSEIVIFDRDSLTVNIIDNQLDVLRSIQFTGTISQFNFGYRAHLLSGKRLAFTCLFTNESPHEFNLVTTDTEYTVVNIDHSNFNDDALECHTGLEGRGPTELLIFKSPEGYICRAESEEKQLKIMVLNQAQQMVDLKFFDAEGAQETTQETKEVKGESKALKKTASYFTPKEPGDLTPIIIHCDGLIRGLHDWYGRLIKIHTATYNAVECLPPVLCASFLNYLNLTAIKLESRIDPRFAEETEPKQAEREKKLITREEKRTSEHPTPTLSPFFSWKRKSNQQIHRKLIQCGLFKDSVMLKKISYNNASSSNRKAYRKWAEAELKRFIANKR